MANAHSFLSRAFSTFHTNACKAVSVERPGMCVSSTCSLSGPGFGHQGVWKRPRCFASAPPGPWPWLEHLAGTELLRRKAPPPEQVRLSPSAASPLKPGHCRILTKSRRQQHLRFRTSGEADPPVCCPWLLSAESESHRPAGWQATCLQGRYPPAEPSEQHLWSLVQSQVNADPWLSPVCLRACSS